MQSLIDKLGSTLVKKAQENSKKQYDNLDEYDKQILNMCNIPLTDSHIKQTFRARDTEDRTINFDDKIQRLLRQGFLDHANDKYFTNPKYREFLTVMTMSSSKIAETTFEDVVEEGYEDGVRPGEGRQLPIDAREELKKMVYDGDDISTIVDYLSNMDSVLDEDFDEDELEELVQDAYSVKESADTGLGMGVVDRTEREEQRESLIGPKVSFRIERLVKKKSSEVIEKENKIADRKKANKEASSYMPTLTSRPKLTKNNLNYHAIAFARKFLSNYKFPICPDIKFNAVKNASQDESLNVSGDVSLSLDMRTLSGVKKRAEIVLPVKNGEFLEPSTMTVDGLTYVIAQSAIDDLVKNATFYEKLPVKPNVFSGPIEDNLYERIKDKKLPKINIGLYSI